MTTNETTVYGVLISTDGRKFQAYAGWDDSFASRTEAEACASRARNNSGWNAKVIEMTADEAITNGWSEVMIPFEGL